MTATVAVTLLTTTSASAATCAYTYWNNGSNAAFSRDNNGACGTMRARHYYTPAPGIEAWTSWAYHDVQAVSAAQATLITSGHGHS